MKKLWRTLITCGLAGSLLTACATPSTQSPSDTTSVADMFVEKSTPEVVIIPTVTASDLQQITLNGTSIESSSAGVQVEGNIATITAAGSYTISGTLDDGQIIVETSDDAPVEIILNGASLRSTTSAPLVIEEASSVLLVLAAGSQNRIADAATYLYPSADVDEPNAAIFSRADLHISGSGSLQIEAAYNDGINSKDGLTISGGEIQIQAVDDGVRGKDYLVIEGGTLAIQAGGDGLKSDNENDASLGYITINNGQISITSEEDAIQAQTDISINGGIFNLASGDDGIHAEGNLGIHGGEITISRSYEGLEAQHISVSAGMISVTASDDGVNGAGGTSTDTAVPGGMPPQGGRPRPGGPGGMMGGGGNSTLSITGGTLVVDANGDGIDVNGSITMDGGLVVVYGPTERMNAALDYDRAFSMNGGTLVAVGSAGMAMAPDQTSTQNGVLINFDTVQDAGQLIHIENSQGQTILTFAPSKEYQSLTFSSPQLSAGTGYTVMVGGSVSGTSQNGLYTEDTYTAGSTYTSFDVTSIITQVGESPRFR